MTETKKGFDSEKLNLFFKGDYQEEDKNYLKELFCDNSKEDDLKHHLKKHWHELLKTNEGSDRNFDHILYKIHYELNTLESEFKSRWSFRNFIKWSTRIAAILFLPLLVYSCLYLIKPSYGSKTTWIEIKAPAWTKAQVSLPDGTTGWLNSNSSIRYNGNFIENRRLTLQGEAFFDVNEDHKHPFVVSTYEIDVTALGTRFNIAAYENENDIEIVLEEGKLEFSIMGMNKSYTMNPNDLVMYNKSFRNFSTEVVHVNPFTSWTQGKLIFRNDPLDVITRRLERWYNIDIEIRGNIQKDIRLRATFVDENIEEVLFWLSRSLPINYKIEDGRITSDDLYNKKKAIITPKK